jgi:hypothetical protein
MRYEHYKKDGDFKVEHILISTLTGGRPSPECMFLNIDGVWRGQIPPANILYIEDILNRMDAEEEALSLGRSVKRKRRVEKEVSSI